MTSSIKIIDTDMGFKEIVKNIGKMDAMVEIGLFGEGNPKENVAARGAVHQFGAPSKNIPPRPFMSQSFDNKTKELKDFITKKYRETTDGRISPKTMLDSIGIFHSDQIKNEIVTGSFQALKKATERRKKSTRPLIDKGIMRLSVKHRIEK